MSLNSDKTIIDHPNYHQLRPYDLPQFFGLVEHHIFRSETLEPIHLPYIQTLELTTILILSPEKPNRTLKSFAEENSIKLIHLGLQAWKLDHAWSAMAEDLIQDSLQILLNEQTHPILVTSTSGIHEVGILIGILRKLQHWSFSSIIFEYRAFAGANARFNEEQFIELFDERQLVLPKNLPSWWIEKEEIWRDLGKAKEMQV